MLHSESKLPQTELPSSKNYPVRIVIKFSDRIQLPNQEGAERGMEGELRESWARIAERYPNATLQPLYQDEDAEAVRKLLAMAKEHDSSYQAPDLFNYFVVQMQPGFAGESLAKMLSAMPGVEIAYVEGGPVDPPVNPTDDPRLQAKGTWKPHRTVLMPFMRGASPTVMDSAFCLWTSNAVGR